MSQPTEPRVLVVIPAWNEAAVLGDTIAEVLACNPGVDLLVVDDGSGDGTAEVADAAGVLVARLPFNLGVGGAMRTGYRYAWREGYDVVVQIDADGQHDPRYLGDLVADLAVANVVIGARFAGKGSYRVRGPRRWAMRLLAKVLSRLSGATLTDVTSGFRAADRKALRVFADHYPAEYLGDTVESLVIAIRSGCVVTQRPVEMRPRTVGTASQTPLRAATYLARAVAALGLALIRRWPAATETRGKESS
jgi:glycosyltransferase involved in cell wall biosynthesis